MKTYITNICSHRPYHRRRPPHSDALSRIEAAEHFDQKKTLRSLDGISSDRKYVINLYALLSEKLNSWVLWMARVYRSISALARRIFACKVNESRSRVRI